MTTSTESASVSLATKRQAALRTRRVRAKAPGRDHAVASPERLSQPAQKEAFRRQLLAWYRANDRSLPWRAHWHKTRDPYGVWVSEIMLQQTVIKAVIPAFQRFLTRFPTVFALAAANEDDIRRAVAGLGYYRRFRMLHAAAKELAARSQDGKTVSWPVDVAEWLALPGIGQYTAAAVASITGSAAAAVVDGNVERIFCRLLDLHVPPDERTLKKPFRALAQNLLDVTCPGDFNQALMELGQLVCTKTQPACATCPVAKFCLARERGTQHLAPANKVRREPVALAMELVIPVKKGRIGLMRRPEGARFLKGTDGFLTLEDGGKGDGWEGAKFSGEVIGKVSHTITHHKLSVEVRIVRGEFPGALTWLKPEAVAAALMSSLDQKAWKLFVRHQREGFNFGPAAESRV